MFAIISVLLRIIIFLRVYLYADKNYANNIKRIFDKIQFSFRQLGLEKFLINFELIVWMITKKKIAFQLFKYNIL